MNYLTYFAQHPFEMGALITPILQWRRWAQRGHTERGELRFTPRQASSTAHSFNAVTHTNKAPWFDIYIKCQLFIHLQ